MSRAVIISCAITGTRPTKADNPAVPISPQEQIESTHEAFEAGAALVHVHVRDEAGGASTDPERYALVFEGIRKHCPGIVVQASTGGLGLPMEERGRVLELRPDMASLATGSVNFRHGAYQNPPRLIESLASRMFDLRIKPEIEVFDLSMLYTARALIDMGLLRQPAHMQFMFGVVGALPPRRQVLDFLVSELHDLMPSATWSAAGMGRAQETLIDWALYLGGHVRTGLEDNIRINRDTLAASNADLVRRAANRCLEYGTHPATAAEARDILELPQVAEAA